MTAGLDASTHVPFGYRGWSFVCGAEREHSGVYKASVLGRFERSDSVTLPADTESFGTPAEALRHAEQQAMRWVLDTAARLTGRTGRTQKEKPAIDPIAGFFSAVTQVLVVGPE